MTRLRCLIVDDEAEARGIFRSAVLVACQDIDIDEAETYEDAKRMITPGKYTIALVDCNLKGRDVESFQGIGVARDLSEAGCDVIVISGMQDRSLSAMADDIANAAFLLKPVKPEALSIAVRRTLRNRESRPPPRGELPPGLEVDPVSSQMLLWHGKRVKLGHVPRDIVMCLARNHGSLVPYATLQQCLISGGRSTVQSHVREIKDCFGRVDKKFDAIKNVFGSGYTWKS